MAGEAVNVSVATKPIKINVGGVGGGGGGGGGETEGAKAESLQCQICSVCGGVYVSETDCACSL